MRQKVLVLKKSFLLVLGLIALFGNGCNSEGNPPFDYSDPYINLFKGRIVNWTMGDHTFILPALDKIDSTGYFICYPMYRVDLDYLAVPVNRWAAANGTITYSDPAVWIGPEVSYLVSSNQNLGTLERTNNVENLPIQGGMFYSSVIYASDKVSIKGYKSDPNNKLMISYSIDFIKGWNRICYKYIFKDTTGVLMEYSSVEPDGAKWVFKPL